MLRRLRSMSGLVLDETRHHPALGGRGGRPSVVQLRRAVRGARLDREVRSHRRPPEGSQAAATTDRSPPVVCHARRLDLRLVLVRMVVGRARLRARRGRRPGAPRESGAMSDVFPLDGQWMSDRWLFCVDHETVWLARSDAAPGAISGDACPRCAPHEQLGPLPRTVHARVIRVTSGLPALPPRCGRPTSADGHPPCRMRVAEPGDACRWHSTGQ